MPKRDKNLVPPKSPREELLDAILAADEEMDDELADEILRRHNLPANAFASELLLPYNELAPLIRKKKATIELAKDIARDFGTCLTAACLKWVDVTEEKSAFVYTIAEAIKWFRRNENFWHYIRDGKLASESLAAQLFKGTNREQDGAVPADAWLDDEKLPSDATIWEDSIFLPSYNSAITLLTIPQEFICSAPLK